MRPGNENTSPSPRQIQHLIFCLYGVLFCFGFRVSPGRGRAESALSSLCLRVKTLWSSLLITRVPLCARIHPLGRRARYGGRPPRIYSC